MLNIITRVGAFHRSRCASHVGVVLVLVWAMVTMSLGSGSVLAAPPGLSHDHFPAGSHITLLPSLSNHALDCRWGFYCEGNVPLYHLHPQDELHRLSGWAQYATWRQHGQVMLFTLFPSRYRQGSPGDAGQFSRAALADLRFTISPHGYRPLHHFFPTIPARDPVSAYASLLLDGSVDIAVAGYQRGIHETEGIVVFSHGYPALREQALSRLREQVLDATVPSP